MNAPVLDGLSLDCPEGSATLVLGECGSGKTTLCSVLSGVAPRYIPGDLKGEVLYGGREASSPHEMLPFFSLVAQNSLEYMVATTVADEVAWPLESLGLPPNEIRSRVAKALEDWGLAHLSEVFPGDLSGGERRRLSLAAAFVTDPGVVVLDEGFDDLDREWKGILAERLGNRDVTVLVTASRFIPEFQGLFGSVFILKDGRLVKTSEVGASEESLFHFTPPSPKEGPALQAENLSFTRKRPGGDFSISVPSFSVPAGGIVSLEGPNGSGKSTLSRILCGLEKPGSGSITLSGRALDQKTLQRTVAYVFQNPDHQIFLPTVREELLFALDRMRLSKEEKERRLDSLCSRFGLRPGDAPAMLSFGMRKKLQCAICLSLSRPFAILDEIDCALPYASAADMVSAFAESGAGVVIVSHDGSFSRKVASGRAVFEGGVLR